MVKNKKQLEIWASGKFREIRTASFTVEAALVMPVVLVTLIALLYMCFYVHNRAWLTAAAYEAALSGSMEGVRKDGPVKETAQLKSESLARTGFYGARNLKANAKVDWGLLADKVVVTYELDTIPVLGNFSWHLKTEAKVKVFRPVGLLRLGKSAGELVQGLLP
jgi:Flp pilus assembly protein TadG